MSTEGLKKMLFQFEFFFLKKNDLFCFSVKSKTHQGKFTKEVRENS